MKKKAKSNGGGVPEWVVTFGDMMSLLLCFFILLQIFSELKKPREYERVVEAVKEAFGYVGGVGQLPVDDPPLKSLIEQLEAVALKSFKQQKVSQSSTEGVEGPQTRVTSIREGMVFTIGGPATFDELSAELKPAARAGLESLATMVLGRNNKIIIRGHASAKIIPPDSPWKDLDELSFARAQAVKHALLELGVDDRNFRLEAVGAREPVRSRVIDPSKAAENRRVEVILSEQLVDETNEDMDFTDPDNARGG